jgi:hypothetical protein
LVDGFGRYVDLKWAQRGPAEQRFGHLGDFSDSLLTEFYEVHQEYRNFTHLRDTLGADGYATVPAYARTEVPR